MSAGAHPQALSNKYLSHDEGVEWFHLIPNISSFFSCIFCAACIFRTCQAIHLFERGMFSAEIPQSCVEILKHVHNGQSCHWKSISETNHLSPLTRPKLRLVPQGTDTQRLANISAHMLGHYGSSSPGNEVWPTCLNSSVFFLQNHHNLRDRLWRLKFCNTVPDGIWEGRWNNKCMIDTMMRLIPHPVHLNLSQVLHATITNMPSVTIRGDKGFSGWLCHTKSGKLQFHRKDPKSAYCTVVWKKARGFHSSFALRIGPCFLLIEF